MIVKLHRYKNQILITIIFKLLILFTLLFLGVIRSSIRHILGVVN